jgi:hypothetical protein
MRSSVYGKRAFAVLILSCSWSFGGAEANGGTVYELDANGMLVDFDEAWLPGLPKLSKQYLNLVIGQLDFLRAFHALECR